MKSNSENSCCENFKMFPRKPQWQSPLRGHPLSMYAKFSKKLPFLTPWYAHVRVRIRGVRNVSFSENFAYVLNGWPLIVTFQLKYSQELNVIPAFTKYKILRYSTYLSENICETKSEKTLPSSLRWHLKPFSGQCSQFTPPENTKKPQRFPGVFRGCKIERLIKKLVNSDALRNLIPFIQF